MRLWKLLYVPAALALIATQSACSDGDDSSTSSRRPGARTNSATPDGEDPNDPNSPSNGINGDGTNSGDGNGTGSTSNGTTTPGGNGSTGGGVDGGSGPTTTPQACGANARKYIGIGGVDLTAGRAQATAGDERARVKPYSALGGEFQRVFGNTPASLGPAAAAFGAPPDRFYLEPTSSAVTIFTTYRVAFDAALAYTNGKAQFSVAPTDATAATECAAFLRKAWSVTPSTAEIDSCKALVITGAATETDARRKWAHGLSAIAASAGFITY